MIADLRASTRIVADPGALAAEAAAIVAGIAAESVRERGRFVVALAGGTTPKGLYARLAAAPFQLRIDWSRTWVFFGDERCVPPADRDSNYRMAQESMLGAVPVPAAQIFRIPGEVPDPAAAAAEYERRLRATFDPEPVRFDLVLLGMGVDGHTASLFPGSPALDERDRLVVAVDARAAAVRARITLTLPVFNAARHVLMLVSGAEKARAVADALRNATSSLPVARVRPAPGTLTWLLDQAAASKLA
jgi:6-phosphogluconolactonase